MQEKQREQCVVGSLLYLKYEYLVGRCQEKVKTLGLAPLYRSAQNILLKTEWHINGGPKGYDKPIIAIELMVMETTIELVNLKKFDKKKCYNNRKL